MRKLKVVLGVGAALIGLINVNSYAVASKTFKASALTRGTGTTDITSAVIVKTVDTTQVLPDTTPLGWGGALGVDLTNPVGWLTSDNAIKINFKVNQPNRFISIYTNNKIQPTAGDTTFVDLTPTILTDFGSSPAGLLDKVNTAPFQTQDTIAWAWAISGTPKAATVPSDIKAADPNLCAYLPTDPRFNAVACPWHYLGDIGTVQGIDGDGNGSVTDTGADKNFVDTAPFSKSTKYNQIIKAANKIHFGQHDAEFGADDDATAYLYFAANFTSAIPGETYTTTTLTLDTITL